MTIKLGQCSQVTSQKFESTTFGIRTRIVSHSMWTFGPNDLKKQSAFLSVYLTVLFHLTKLYNSEQNSGEMAIE